MGLFTLHQPVKIHQTFSPVCTVFYLTIIKPDPSWNVMAHVDAREGKWRGNWRMGWVAVLFTLPGNLLYPALLPLMCTPRLPVFDWTDAPADLNGLVRFAEKRNLVSARVPSHFKRNLPKCNTDFRYGVMLNAWKWTRGPIHPPHTLTTWFLVV